MPYLTDDLSYNLDILNKKFEIYKNKVSILLTDISDIKAIKDENLTTNNNSVIINENLYLITHDNVLMKYKDQETAKKNLTYYNNPIQFGCNDSGCHGMDLKKCDNDDDNNGAVWTADELGIEDNSFVFLKKSNFNNKGFYVSNKDGGIKCLDKLYYTDSSDSRINSINNNLLYYDQNIDASGGGKYYIDTYGYFHSYDNDSNFECDDDYRNVRPSPDPKITVNEISGNLSDYPGDCRYQHIFKKQIEDMEQAELSFYKQFNIVLGKYNNFDLSENNIENQIDESRQMLQNIIDKYNNLKQDIDKNNKLKNITNAQKKDMKRLSDHMQFKMATISIFGIIFILLLFNFIKK